MPIQSPRPLLWFAALRAGMIAVAIAALAVFDVPGGGTLLVLAAAVALPVALAEWVVARRAPALALNPAVALVDLGILAFAEALAPASYAAVHFLALFVIAAHAHFQGEYRGTAIALAAVILLVPIAATTDAPVSGGLLAFCETLFAAAAIAAGLFMGRLRTLESVGRLRARELSRRVIEAEGQVRRRIAETIHDGPVQELVSLDMVLDTARRAVERGDSERAIELLEDARLATERNIGSLREEIVSLGPYAFDELTLDVALEQCAPVWSRRYGLPIELDLEDLNLSNETCGSLFGIAQEAVANAGRHSGASSLIVSVTAVNGGIELRVKDDGRGFDQEAAMEWDEPGHIGLPTMRERAELVGGALTIDSGRDGTTVLARVPLGPGDEVRD